MSLTRKRPEDVGIHPSSILSMMDACDESIDHLHGFMIAKDGAIVAECSYAPCSNQVAHNGLSLGKSMTALAVGMLIDEGKLRFDTEVVPMFKDQLPEAYDPRLEHLTVGNLLNMQASSAIVSTPFLSQPKGSWIAHYFSYKPEADPGTVFHYDTGGYYLLSCVVTKVAGENVYSYLNRKLFSPLGIQNGYFQEDGVGNNVGGWGFYFNLEDELKIAQCLTDDGVWEGKQLIPKWFVDSLKTPSVSTREFPHLGWTYGYSNGFWKGKESIFLAFGAFGQLLICDPQRHITVATSGGCSHEDCKQLLEIIQNCVILTANSGAIPRDEGAFAKLDARLKNAQLPLPPGCLQAGGEVCGTFAPQEPCQIRELCLLDAGNGKLQICLDSTSGAQSLIASCQAWTVDSHGTGCAYGWDGHRLSIYIQDPALTAQTRMFLEFHGGDCEFSQTSSPSLTAISGKPNKLLRK